MYTHSPSLPGFAILQNPRGRSAAAARADGCDPLAFADDASPDLDAVADTLAALEGEAAALAPVLSPAKANAVQAELARAGARVIEARFEEADDASIAALHDTLLGLEGELRNARVRHEEDAALIRALEDETERLGAELTETHWSLVAERARSEAAEKALAMHEDRLRAAVQAARAAREAEAAALRDERDDLRLAVQDLEVRVQGLAAENESLHVASDLARAQLSDTEAMLRATHGELVRTRARAAEQAAGLRAELNAVRAALESAVAELEEERAENVLMESWMNAALSRHAELTNRINELECEISSATLAVA